MDSIQHASKSGFERNLGALLAEHLFHCHGMRPVGMSSQLSPLRRLRRLQRLLLLLLLLRKTDARCAWKALIFPTYQLPYLDASMNFMQIASISGGLSSHRMGTKDAALSAEQVVFLVLSVVAFPFSVVLAVVAFPFSVRNLLRIQMLRIQKLLVPLFRVQNLLTGRVVRIQNLLVIKNLLRLVVFKRTNLLRIQYLLLL
jgi:hypothetical protein